jgi:uncharacterized repeat protein (TIGR03803 family)
MKRIRSLKLAIVIAVFCVAAAVASPAQTFTTLFTFDGTNGNGADGSLIQGTDGNFYGTTAYGGESSSYCPFSFGCGTVFKITPDGKLTTLYSFCRNANCTDGTSPVGALYQGANGNFYGAAAFGGTSNYCSTVFPTDYGCGTIFEITPGGKIKTLYNFCSQANCADGAAPNGSLVLGPNGNLYGTVEEGGAHCVNADGGYNGCGTVFEITAAGKLSTVYSFCAQIRSNGICTDGNTPLAGLVLAPNGNFYGTTPYGGSSSTCVSSGCGTVFELTPAGKLTTLYSFCTKAHCADGVLPANGLMQASNGKFYGTTEDGGNTSNAGTVFEITTTGKFATIHDFCTTTSCSDGLSPNAGLIQATDGNLYGAATLGGTSSYCPNNQPRAAGCGTLFKISQAGDFTVLYNFCSQSLCPDGLFPEQTLLQGTDGILYGPTFGDDINSCGCGTIFSFSSGLSPFVAANPNFGVAGRVVNILGNNLTGTSSVTFNTTPATFSVGSGGTYIKATVPAGATTGTIEVTTPSGTLSSNVAFQVLP